MSKKCPDCDHADMMYILLEKLWRCNYCGFEIRDAENEV